MEPPENHRRDGQHIPEDQQIWVAPWYEAYQRLRESRGFVILQAIRSRQITFYSFTRNFAELDSMASAHYQLRETGKLGDFNDRVPLEQYLFELTRRLQNFVFSAKSLVDHTRNYVQATHPSGLPAYHVAVHERFGKTGIAAFTKGLRDYFAHCATPFVSSTIGCSEAEGRDRFKLELDAESMTRSEGFAGWAPPAVRYIARYPNGCVDLKMYIEDYYDCVIRFCTWFDDQNEKWCAQAFQEAAAIEDEIDRFQNRHTVWRKQTKAV